MRFQQIDPGMAEEAPDTAAPAGEENQTGKAPNRAASQMARLRDANTKYKSLLKMAKERIQTQEDELVALRGTACCDGFVAARRHGTSLI